MRVLEQQAAGWEEDEWFDMLVALHGVAGRVRRAGDVEGEGHGATPVPAPPMHDETLNFLVGLTLFAANLEGWVEEIAASGAVANADGGVDLTEPTAEERLLR